MTNLQINGQKQSADVPQETPLLWVLRDELGLCGTKFGCGMALCGACTVHLDGQPIRSCITPISAVEGKKVSTIESMESDRVGKVVQAALAAQGVQYIAWSDAALPEQEGLRQGEVVGRFVCSFATQVEEVERLAAVLAGV